MNITVPLDVTGKRRSRTDAAIRARRVTEAQFLDAVRVQVDNLYTAYVDVISATETLRFSEAFLGGIARLLEVRRSQLTAGEIVPAEVDELVARLEQAQLQVRESRESLITSKRTIALMLSIPRQQADAIELRASIRDFREVGRPDEELVRMGLENRPDLIAQRLGVQRADAEIKVARASRYSDVYLDFPTDPAQPVTGTAALYDKNASNTGSILVLDLADQPRQPADEIHMDGQQPVGRDIQRVQRPGDAGDPLRPQRQSPRAGIPGGPGLPHLPRPVEHERRAEYLETRLISGPGGVSPASTAGG